MEHIRFLKPLQVRNKVRIGNRLDGGYVVYATILPQTDVLMTYGIGWDVSFEEHFHQLTQKPVYMFDHTMFDKYMVDFRFVSRLLLRLRVKELVNYLWFILTAWRKWKTLDKKGVHFVNEGIGSSRASKLNTFENHLRRFKLSDKQVFLKMDIEGSEYALFSDPAFYRQIRNVNQMVIELHDLKNRMRDAQRMMEKLSNDYALVHVHGNNYAETFVLYGNGKEENDITIPDTLELTLVRRNLINAADRTRQTESYPVSGLDYPNNPLLPDYTLRFF